MALPAIAGGANPAVVTHTEGSVQLQVGGHLSEAPLPPFLLQTDQSLVLGDGARVAVLNEGVAQAYPGPLTLGLANLGVPEVRSAPEGLDALLLRGASDARSGATRIDGPIQLTRPVPGSQVLSLGPIRWACEDCGPQSVQVVALPSGEVIWQGEGTDGVVYGGPAPREGLHAVTLAGRDHPFVVVPATERTHAEQLLASVRSEGLSPLEQASLEAALLLQAGHPSDALVGLDAAAAAHSGDPAWAALVARFEERAGL